MQRLVI